MRIVKVGWLFVAFPVVCAAAVAASLPPALHGAGQWEISRSANGSGAVRQCLSDPALMAQWEHRKSQCTRIIVSSANNSAEVHYTCTGGEFGTSRVNVLTPRSVKVHTQGISHGLPFGYTLHARRIGNCSAR
jgi:hypothetical protein